jgi:ppGpp synthetase/RelA/SpoT-type nucleotidyltranferase
MTSGVDNVTTSELKSSYDLLLPTAVRFKEKLLEEIGESLDQADVTLATPMEGRIKTWQSAIQKTKTLNLALQKVEEIEDLIGIRLILLFARDIERVCNTLSQTFEIVNVEDTGTRLGQSEFGYQSIHMQIRAPENWLVLPSFSAFRGLTAEIQVRTATQHIWAAASHLLQYKAEEGVPIPVRRSIHRVSALLETVDLEFERVLQDRETYLDQIHQLGPHTVLDVDVLIHFLAVNLPDANWLPDDDYAELLTNLRDADANTVGDLLNLFDSTKDAALEHDARIAAEFSDPGNVDVEPEVDGIDEDEIDQDEREYSVEVDGMTYTGDRLTVGKGVFYSHVGLVREMIGIAGKPRQIGFIN